LFGPKLDIISVEGSKIRPVRITKGSQTCIVGFLFKKNLKRRRELQDFGEQAVD
jgi:hypothetical protein